MTAGAGYGGAGVTRWRPWLGGGRGRGGTAAVAGRDIDPWQDGRP
jgi:hypothetical protein